MYDSVVGGEGYDCVWWVGGWGVIVCVVWWEGV